MMQTLPETSQTRYHCEEIRNLSGQIRRFFGFSEDPFNNTPDPDFFYLSGTHREVLVSLLYGVQERRGFITVTGEIGSGKTTLCRAFLRELSPQIRTAVILNPCISAAHLLESIARDFGLSVGNAGKRPDKRTCFRQIESFLLRGLEQSQNACIIIDEAQKMSPRVLEELRMLTNLETPKKKLLQIILIGQPELKQLLSRPALKQLRQRIAVFSHLRGLSLEEMKQYLDYRLSLAAGGPSPVGFSDRVLEQAHALTGGIPRLVNTAADRILMAAFFRGTRQIEPDVCEDAFEEIRFACTDGKDVFG